MNIRNKLSEENKINSGMITVYLKRESFIESSHNAHAVICDNKGRILMKAGEPKHKTFIRSALKPFQAMSFISSGAFEQTLYDEKALAISCGSHSGSKYHAREVFKLLWNSDVDVEALKCPVPRDRKSKLEHNCSGKHAAFLAICKKMKWPIKDYLELNHPLQIEINRRVSELLGISQDNLIAARDDCGAPTLRLELSQMAYLYALLSGSEHNELEQISRAMRRQPTLLAGQGKFDTELIERGHGQIISKSGAEGIQCLSKVGQGLGIAIKVEDGSKRAKYAVALHLLKQLEWITPSSLQELEEQVLKIKPGLELEVQGELRFQEK